MACCIEFSLFLLGTRASAAISLGGITKWWSSMTTIDFMFLILGFSTKVLSFLGLIFFLSVIWATYLFGWLWFEESFRPLSIEATYGRVVLDLGAFLSVVFRCRPTGKVILGVSTVTSCLLLIIPGTPWSIYRRFRPYFLMIPGDFRFVLLSIRCDRKAICLKAFRFCSSTVSVFRCTSWLLISI